MKQFSNLEARLEALKALHDTECYSSDETPFPLWAFLVIIRKAYYEAIVKDWGQGVSSLANWLGKLEYKKYPEVEYHKNFQSVLALEIYQRTSIQPSDIQYCWHYEVQPRFFSQEVINEKEVKNVRHTR